MSNEIIATIDHLCDKLGIAIDWTSETIGPMVQEFVEKYTRYLLAYNVFWLVTCIVLMAASCVTLRITFKAVENKKEWAYSSHFREVTSLAQCLWWFSILIAAICFIASLAIANNIIKCYTVPELLVLQELKKLLG